MTRLERAMRLVSPEPMSGCWLWTGYVSPSGYGVIGDQLAHRLFYESLVGVVPDGLELDHLCRVTCCVNPSHLEPVTHRENMLRGISPTAQNAVKTHCNRGHELVGANLRLQDGKRSCKACVAAKIPCPLCSQPMNRQSKFCKACYVAECAS